MATTTCRWGILSTAGIAKKNWKAIRRSGNATVAAVASRSASSAAKFIEECQSFEPFAQVPDAVEGYDALLQRKDIDAVYIPLPTGLRTEWVLKAANAGKHVLAEKPAGMNAGEVNEILRTCEKNKVQYMDGVMFMHSARLPKLRATLDDGKSVGEIRRVMTQFSFCGDEAFLKTNIRSMSPTEPHGCLGDLGWYCIRMILWTLKWKAPRQVIGRTLREIQGNGSPEGVPGEFAADLLFDNGLSASFYCSFLTQHQQWVNISGDKGFVTIPDFVLPYHGPEVGYDVCNNEFVTDGCDFFMDHHVRKETENEYSQGRATAQEVSLFRNFSSLVNSGKLDPHWGKITLATQMIIDAAFQSARNGSKPVDIPADVFPVIG